MEGVGTNRTQHCAPVELAATVVATATVAVGEAKQARRARAKWAVSVCSCREHEDERNARRGEIDALTCV